MNGPELRKRYRRLLAQEDALRIAADEIALQRDRLSLEIEQVRFEIARTDAARTIVTKEPVRFAGIEEVIK